MQQAVPITTGLQPRKLLCTLAARYLQFIFKYKVYVYVTGFEKTRLPRTIVSN